MSNRCGDVASALAFIASGERVITNSYHGMYWATLMKRRVCVIPTRATRYKFVYARHPPTLCATVNEAIAATTRVYTEALHECREANERHSVRVREWIERAGAEKPRLQNAVKRRSDRAAFGSR
jgi:exopolysaccharide biosynthesis predicted pyruvyltransferase EpsI